MLTWIESHFMMIMGSFVNKTEQRYMWMHLQLQSTQSENWWNWLKIIKSKMTVGNLKTAHSTINRISPHIPGRTEKTEHGQPTWLNRHSKNRRSTPPKYTLFSNTHGTLSKIDLMLSYKISFNIFERTEIIIKYSLQPNQY